MRLAIACVGLAGAVLAQIGVLERDASDFALGAAMVALATLAFLAGGGKLK